MSLFVIDTDMLSLWVARFARVHIVSYTETAIDGYEDLRQQKLGFG